MYVACTGCTPSPREVATLHSTLPKVTIPCCPTGPPSWQLNPSGIKPASTIPPPKRTQAQRPTRPTPQHHCQDAVGVLCRLSWPVLKQLVCYTRKLLLAQFLGLFVYRAAEVQCWDARQHLHTLPRKAATAPCKQLQQLPSAAPSRCAAAHAPMALRRASAAAASLARMSSAPAGAGCALPPPSFCPVPAPPWDAFSARLQAAAV